MARPLCVLLVLVALAGCGKYQSSIPATPELLADTFTVRVREPCTPARGCSGGDPSVQAFLGCDAVLDFKRGRGWADCAYDMVEASATILADGGVELSFGPNDSPVGPWRIICDGAFNDTGSLIFGRAQGRGFDPSDTTFSAARWPP
jgi:hypothetical protein